MLNILVYPICEMNVYAYYLWYFRVNFSIGKVNNVTSGFIVLFSNSNIGCSLITQILKNKWFIPLLICNVKPEKKSLSIQINVTKPKLRDIYKVICSSKLKKKNKLKICFKLRETKETWLSLISDPKQEPEQDFNAYALQHSFISACY